MYSLTNEDAETFNFGVKDGVRGFFTNPSRADDSFIPFSNSKIGMFYRSSSGETNEIVLGFKPSVVVIFYYSGKKDYPDTMSVVSIKSNSIHAFYLNGYGYNNVDYTGIQITESGFSYKEVNVDGLKMHEKTLTYIAA